MLGIWEVICEWIEHILDQIQQHLFLATLNVIDESTDRDTLYKIITNKINETSKRFTLIPQYWIDMLKCWYTHDYDGSRYGENYSACGKFQMNNSDIDKYMQ